MATIIGTDGTTREVVPLNGVSFTLPELHAVVGGYIEQVTLAVAGRTREVLFVNEDGLRAGFPLNTIATAMAMQCGVPGVAAHGIVGSVIHCRVADAGTDDERIY